MNSKTKILVGTVFFAAFIAVAVFTYTGLSEKVSPETPFDLAEDDATNIPGSENEPVAAPDFTALDNEGNEVKLSDYFGRPIVLNFWASWCSPCKREMPYFNAVYEETKDDIVFLMVDMVDGRKETEAKGKKYIADNGFVFPVLFDTDQNGAYAYGIRSIPTTFFIDVDGNIAAGFEGAMSEEILWKGIDLIGGEKE